MNILLEKFTQQDFDDYFRLVSDARVMAMITERAIPVDEAGRDYQQLLIKNKAHPDAGHFRILDADSGEFIGLGKLEIDPGNSDTAELGYMILPVYWGLPVMLPECWSLKRVSCRHCAGWLPLSIRRICPPGKC